MYIKKKLKDKNLEFDIVNKLLLKEVIPEMNTDNITNNYEKNTYSSTLTAYGCICSVMYPAGA